MKHELWLSMWRVVVAFSIPAALVAAEPNSKQVAEFVLTDALRWTDSAAESDSTIVRSRPVLLDGGQVSGLDLKPDSALAVGLFADASVIAVVERVEMRSPDDYTLFGRLDGKPGSNFVMVVRQGVVMANFRALGEPTYQIRYLGPGVHVAREIDESKFPPCGTNHEDETRVPPAPPLNRVATGCDDDGSVIDMMVVYTQAARGGQGGTAGIEALITLAEAETNQGYLNSGIATSVRVVLMYEVDYVETQDSAIDRERISNPNDGYIDEVPDLRNLYSADVVSFILNDLSVCGRAFFSIQAGNVPYPDLGYNVVKASCATGYYSFGHELGHNQGARHDRGADPSDGGAYLYSHGYQDPGEAFRTVMAYNCPNGCPRVLQFSNPDLLYESLVTGVPVGEPDSAHNALSINNTAYNVANFRPSRDCNLNGVCDDVDIADGTSFDCNSNDFPDECEIDCNGNGAADECDIADGTSDDCTGNGVPDECERDCNLNDLADSCDIFAGGSLDANGNAVPDECEPPILYVDWAATGRNTGTSWTDAFNSPNDAYTIADESLGAVKEVWVVRGTYKPAEPGGDREAAINLASGVGYYAGFAGWETSREQRDPIVNVTVLSGDLNGDDEPNFSNYNDNSYSVVIAREVDATTRIDGFTITSGERNSDAPFIGGLGGAAGMAVIGSDLTVSNCTFVKNYAYGGAGMGISIGSNATVTHCRFIGNESQNGGGALAISDSDVEVRNCVFASNTTGDWGGAIGSTVRSTLHVFNSTFVDNVAGRGGAVATLIDGETTITNSILHGNTAPQGPELDAMHASTSVSVTFSNVQGGAASVLLEEGATLVWGSGNIDAAPIFADADYHLSPSSPCVNAGDPQFVAGSSEVDLDGDERIRECRIDMGADESPYYAADCNTNGSPDACDIADGSSNDFNANNVPDECEPNRTIYVDLAFCPGPGTGTEVDPFCTIQDAIDSAGDGQFEYIQVVIADGIYTGIGNMDLDFGGRSITVRSANGPAGCIIDPQGAGRGFYFHSGESRGALLRDITITGGGGTLGGAIYIEDSNPFIDGCVLTYNELAEPGAAGGAIASVRSAPTINRCQITNNYAEKGGAIYCEWGQPTISNCTIADNGGNNGAGVYCTDSSPSINHCLLARNIAENIGGAWINDARSDPEITDCIFEANQAQVGGAMANQVSSYPIVTNCIFRKNIASGGGGIYNAFSSAPTLINCLFAGNAASGAGGAISDTGLSRTTAINCTIVGNTVSPGSGGGLAHYSATYPPTITNCILWGNVGGGGIDESAQIRMTNGIPIISYSTVQAWSGTFGGVGNIGLDPLFRDADGPDGIVGTEDDDLRLSRGSPCVDAGDNDALLAGVTTDLDGNPRTLEDPEAADTGNPGQQGPPIVDMGALERVADCNGNGISDETEISSGSSADCNVNGIPDECEVPPIDPEGSDCNSNGVPDSCEPDEDCNSNGARDICDIAAEVSEDCNLTLVPDECELAGNDCNGNTVPDECEPDCNENETADSCDVTSGTSEDCDENGIPDECEPDCNINGVVDTCDIGDLTSWDVNSDGIPDECALEPRSAQVPYSARKNRYITLNPNNTLVNVALEVTLASMRRCSGDMRRSCDTHADCPKVCAGNIDLQCVEDSICGSDGPCVSSLPCVEHSDVGNVVKYVNTPYTKICVPLDDCGDQWFASLVGAPVYRVWTEDVVHVTDCVIVPVAEYEIRATVDGVSFAGPLIVGTIRKPNVHYGDAVGPVVAGQFTPADGFTNVADLQAYLIANQGGASAPHTTWVDLQGVSGTSICIPPTGGCVVPQQILNVGDLQTIKFGFLGQTYVETPGHENPGDCP